jgi:hypothetical protein
MRHDSERLESVVLIKGELARQASSSAALPDRPGALFGAAVSRIALLQLTSLTKAVGLGILYVELMSQPLLAAAACVLHMTAAETAQWFGISFVMHLIYGLALGLVTYYGLRGISAARQI